MVTAEYYTRLFEYEARCTELVVTSLHAARETVEQLGLASLAAPYERAVAIFCHIQAARRLWLHRVGAAEAPAPEDGLFPIWDIRKAERQARELDALWPRHVATLRESDLARPMSYTSTEGVAYVSTLADILTHVVNHSTYHRGQIASLVAATGTKPAVTDFIALTRQTL